LAAGPLASGLCTESTTVYTGTVDEGNKDTSLQAGLRQTALLPK